MSFEPVIQVCSLSKQYGSHARPHQRLIDLLLGREARSVDQFSALADVSFSVFPGETVGVVGRNGSGKSTLLQCICGTLDPSRGSVEVSGRIAALLELGAGFNPEFTGIENVRLNAALLGLTHAEIDRRMSAILAFADIGDFVWRPVKTYSSGMFVRLAFAVVAHVDADVLVVDEALAVGDAFFTQKCMRFLRDFKARGGTLLFVSHDAASVIALCDRAIWLDGGSIRLQGDAKSVMESYLASQYDTADTANSPSSEGDEAEHEDSIRLPDSLPEWVAGDSFGDGGARLVSVVLLDSSGRSTMAVDGGARVCLRIEAVANTAIGSPILGFQVKNRIGQILFGENSSSLQSDELVDVVEGERFFCEFHFTMPTLNAGEYVITAAVAEGSQSDHRVHHWVYDALVFTSQTVVLHGLMAIPADLKVGKLRGRVLHE
ncbi:ABC transporter ATP-binding protein [Chitinimonas sp. BJYL2]|uniref:ABC transporter ATP-binding protein n=1 Tax=Chitinimonas sp. BJYL2 TaxID=2976696 RepID=UPI0022B4E9F5|nr:ABC transporter ATP-binding protein [Chitinimonas sp. BJYL2]